MATNDYKFINWLAKEKTPERIELYNRIIDETRTYPNNRNFEFIEIRCMELDSYRDLKPVFIAAAEDYIKYENLIKEKDLLDLNNYDFDPGLSKIYHIDELLKLFCSYYNGIPNEITKKEFFKMLHMRGNILSDQTCKSKLNTLLEFDIISPIEHTDRFKVHADKILEKLNESVIDVSIDTPEGKTTILWKYSDGPEYVKREIDRLRNMHYRYHSECTRG